MLRRRLAGVALLGSAFFAFAPAAAAQTAAGDEPAYGASARPDSAEPVFQAVAKRPPSAPAAAQDDTDGAPGAVDAREEWDPIEPVNRGLFAFNDAFDIVVLEPAARGWKTITPQAVRDAVDRFFVNLEFPMRFVGCLAQGRLVDSGEEVARFVVNTTVGIGGLFNPAGAIGLELNDEDFGQAMGTWGVGPGPYLVLPLFGVTSTRDLLDFPLSAASSLIPGLNVLNVVNTRAELLSEVSEAKAASLDYYAFVRNAYLQRRRAQILDETQVPQETDDDLYKISEESR